MTKYEITADFLPPEAPHPFFITIDYIGIAPRLAKWHPLTDDVLLAQTAVKLERLRYGD